jgi:hypothetical protein
MQIGLRWLLVLAVVCGIPARAQDASRVPEPALVKLRNQTLTLARRIVDAAELPAGSRVAPRIQDPGAVGITEMSLLQALQERSMQSPTDTAGDSSVHALRVLVLRQDVVFGALLEGGYRRSVTTILDAALEEREPKQLRYLGQFEASEVDTVSEVETLPARRNAGATSGQQKGTVDKIVLPLVVVATAVTIVYLFFTVRS